jgi:hypothetical protein
MQKNHVYTSGATGTNAAVIRGALRAEKPDLLTVVLPQSLSKQPPESQELLAQVCKCHQGGHQCSSLLSVMHAKVTFLQMSLRVCEGATRHRDATQ